MCLQYSCLKAGGVGGLNFIISGDHAARTLQLSIYWTEILNVQWGQLHTVCSCCVDTKKRANHSHLLNLMRMFGPAYYFHCFLWEYVSEVEQSEGTNEKVSGSFSMNCTRHLASNWEGCNKIVYISLCQVSPLQSWHCTRWHCNNNELSICCVTSSNNNVLHLAVTKHIQYIIINILMMILVAINLHCHFSSFIFLPNICRQHCVLTLSSHTPSCLLG